MTELFSNGIIKGADFSTNRKYRYALWRIWDDEKPKVMFIGLNPSTANEQEDDATINRVKSIASYNGFGGIYMLNCFPYISTNPADVPANVCVIAHGLNYNSWIYYAGKCSTVVFAWGNFDIVTKHNVDKELLNLFPNAKALHINKNGSPKHPLYCRIDSKLIEYKRGISKPENFS